VKASPAAGEQTLKPIGYCYAIKACTQGKPPDEQQALSVLIG